MNRFITVFKREYLANIKNKWFWIATIIGPLIFIGIIFVPVILSTFEQEPTANILIIGSDKYLSNDEINKFITNNISIELSNTTAEEAKDKLRNSDNIDVLADFNTINPDNNNYDISILSKQALGFSQETIISDFIIQIMQDIRIKKEQIPIEQAERINKEIYPTFSTLDSEEASSFQAFILAYGIASLMYFLILFYSSKIMSSVQEEKKNRIVEVLLSSMNTSSLLFGKIFGVLALGLTQIFLWCILSLISIPIIAILISPLLEGVEMSTDPNESLGATSIIWAELQGINGNLNIFILFIIFLGFLFFGLLLYAGIFACIASSTDSEAEAQNLSIFGFLPVIISLLSLNVTIDNPSSNITTILSMIPFISPINMMARIPFNVPIWEILLSLIILILTSLIVILLASKLYRAGILLYGEKLSWKHIKNIFIK